MYDDLAPLVLGYLRTQHAREPEDVTSEVFLQVVRDLRHFDGDESDFRSWVLAITHNRLTDARRHHGRRPSSPSPVEDIEPSLDVETLEDAVIADLSAQEFGRHLDTLTDDQRAVLVLRFVAELKIREVAALLDKRENAIKQLQRRGLDSLRRSLEDDP